MENLFKNSNHVFDAFCKITEVPLTFFDRNGSIQREWGEDKKICGFFDVYQTRESVCTSVIYKAADITSRLGEPYIFSCKAGFSNIAFALILHGEVAGCFVAGPIILEKINQSTITNIFNINDLNSHPETISALTVFLQTLRIHSPESLSHISTLLSSSILSAVTPNMDYIKLRDLYKKMTSPEGRLHGEQGELRIPTESSANATKKEKRAALYGGSSNLIKQAVQIMKTNYMHKISLEEISRKLYINQSYLSMHFKHEMGVT